MYAGRAANRACHRLRGHWDGRGRPRAMSRTLDPEIAAAMGRIGSHRLHGLRDSRETTAAARAAFLCRFESVADPDGTLEPAERRRRAEHLQKAYFLQLAFRSVEARIRQRDA